MWTDPNGHVWTTGEMVTAASMNTYIKDNLLALYSPPAFRVYETVAQNIPDSTWTAVTLGSERHDPTGMHSTVANKARGTVAVAGRYLAIAQMELAYDATGFRLAGIWVNGTTLIISTSRDPGSGSNFSPVMATEWVFAATDYAEMKLWQNSGGGLLTVIGSTAYAPEFSMSWQGN